MTKANRRWWVWAVAPAVACGGGSAGGADPGAARDAEAVDLAAPAEDLPGWGDLWVPGDAEGVSGPDLGAWADPAADPTDAPAADDPGAWDAAPDPGPVDGEILPSEDLAAPDLADPGGAGDTGGPDAPPPASCDNPPLPEPPSGSCTLAAGDAWLLVRGDIVVPGGLLHNGHLLVDATGIIRCAACDCSGQPGFAGATRLDCRYGLVSPGLINAHDHITYAGNDPADHGTERYDHRHEWRKGLNGHTAIPVPQTSGAVAWGELRHVLAGTTSLFGSGGVAGLVRNLDKDTSGLDPAKKVTYDTFPLGDSGGQMLVGSCSYPSIQSASSVAQMHCYIPHVAEGVNDAARNEFLCLSGARAGGQDLVRPNTAFIHGVGVRPEDVAAMAAEGTGLVWSPRSNLDLYGNTAPVSVYARMGVRIALGTDWTASGSMNLLREVRCADSFNRTYLDGVFTDRDLLDMVTSRAAEVMGLDDLLGSLKPGLLADIAIFDTHGAADERAVLDAGVRDVVLVLRAGVPLYGDADLVAGLPGGETGCEVLDVCGIARRVCAQRETGQTVAALKPASAYPLFFCDAPDSEPSCVPFRPGEYDGIPAEDDLDGDGVPNAVDDCPRVFDPPRPVDHGKQADADGDGVGDACDPCPLVAFATECAAPDPNDPDGDGLPSALDNCPSAANPGQEDRDQDGKGDACDPCPDAFNPGLDPCPATIRDLKTGAVPLDTRVQVGPALVTGVGTKDGSPQGYFLQMVPGDPGYVDADWSGIYVYHPAGAGGVAAGDRVVVAGVVHDYYGQVQVSEVSSLSVTSHGEAAPDPVPVLAAEVATGGPRAASLEGVVVRIEDVGVTDTAPPPGPGDPAPTHEFVVEGVLRVNDFIHRVEPFPTVGQTYATLAGVLRFANGHSKLEPRGPEDAVLARPRLVALEPDPGFVLAGAGPMVPVPGLRVRLDHPGGGPVWVEVVSGDETRVAIPGGGVEVPAGSAEADVLAEGLVSDPDPVPITAILGDDHANAGIRVVGGDEVPTLALLHPEEMTIEVGAQGAVFAFLDIPTFLDPVTLEVSSEPAGVVDHPGTVEVPQGDIAVSIPLTGLAAGDAEVRVTLGGVALAALVRGVEPASARLMLAEVYYDHPGTDDGFEWVRIYNGTAQAVDLSGYSLGMGGTDYTTGRYALSGVVGPGQCFLVGGPGSVPDNGAPVYSQVLNFSPDLQNSDTTADGVALFAVPASQVAKTTVPVDAVIYGVQNTNGLLDASGGPGPVHVGDAPAGKSLLRAGVDQWVVSLAPTPNACDPIR